jgi:hypothetical protein
VTARSDATGTVPPGDVPGIARERALFVLAGGTMSDSTIRRRRVLALAALAFSTPVLAACAAFAIGAAAGPPAPAPAYHVGDRWVYQAKDGFRNPVVWEEVHEVTSVGADGIRVRVTQAGPNVSNARVEQFAAPGIVRVGALFDAETRRFARPLARYDFPLAPGRTWNQFVANFNEETNKEGEINRYVRVGGWEKVTTPAGTFDAIRMTVLMRLDDEEFWRRPTECAYVVWYAPAVRGVVREDKEAQYLEKGDAMDGMSVIRSQHATLQLVRFVPGA